MRTIQTFDYSVNILRALLWRNNNAQNITALLNFKQAYFDSESEDFWTDWVKDVFDLRTANEFGLNVWSVILGLPITIEPVITSTPNSNFGFGPDRLNFENGNFSPSVGEFSLSIAEARLVLRLRYYQLTTNGNVTDINLLIEDVFGSLGPAYVVDNFDMTISYVFLFSLSTIIQRIMADFDLLPRPAGVKVLVVTAGPANENFGFGALRKNFDNGNFSPVV